MQVQFLIVFCLAAVRCQATESVLGLFPEFNKVQEKMGVLQRDTGVLQKENGVLQRRIDALEKENKVLKAQIGTKEFGRFNLAYKKNCGQSSTYLEACSHAVDGNVVTFSHTGHTGFRNGVNYGTSKPSWWVDLGNTYKIRRVEVYNRLSSGHRLYNLDVTAGKSLSGMSLCGHYKGRATNGELVILVCRQPIEARYVKLQIMEANSADNYLQLAEVEVYE
ncbi:uncharacterized protein LOC127720685 [Mytilus californianus]|uniref:uncharacterized protein LOC127720685 n=1 Tax=Mytilus californianus TaxID=6549 RepID=UPI0022459C6E|nr:uncharacterized protein LOC127720685 [Mytilus californianus]